ncbi:hypothetical protein T06_15793 [Trichinella sp. T6]|nr:hypothetical protein T06_15793 [Trichinella sp. T6]
MLFSICSIYNKQQQNLPTRANCFQGNLLHLKMSGFIEAALFKSKSEFSMQIELLRFYNQTSYAAVYGNSKMENNV